MSAFKTVEHACDLCVVGGGLAGTIAALSAARKGAKVLLMQDRPVLGGNCSSEIRMWVRGAKGVYNRESGILKEFEEENIYRNPTLAPTLWDSVLFGKVKGNENIELLLNCSCLDAECEENKIKSVTGWQLTTYTYHRVTAKLFADCSGDSILAPLSGAKHRLGREAKEEYGEDIGPDVTDEKTMGMSCLLQARETEHPVKFVPPSWAKVYETDEDFAIIPYLAGQHSTFRDHKIGTSGCNLWWMELGGDTGRPIENTEETRDELIKVAFGIWDHLKNRGDHGYENWTLEWVGFLPGKRESRRYVGDHVLTQRDIESGGLFPDVVAYGGWPMDDHNPKGMMANKATDTPSYFFPAPSPYGIPYRCLYSVNIENLFFAGRNISATHAALSSTRVMGTCALLGQAVGNATAICVAQGCSPREVYKKHLHALQQEILEDGVFLPGKKREISLLSQKAKLNISDEDKTLLFNGIDRPRSDEEINGITLREGDELIFSFDVPQRVEWVRIELDPDYSRESISVNRKMRMFAQKLHEGLDFKPVKTAATIVKELTVLGDGKVLFRTENNIYSSLRLPLSGCFSEIRVCFGKAHGAETFRLFACDVN